MEIKYKHFKGKIYTVLCYAKHTETNEDLVIYTDGNEFYARPKEMFFDKVKNNGIIVQRFKKN